MGLDLAPWPRTHNMQREVTNERHEWKHIMHALFFMRTPVAPSGRKCWLISTHRAHPPSVKSRCPALTPLSVNLWPMMRNEPKSDHVHHFGTTYITTFELPSSLTLARCESKMKSYWMVYPLLLHVTPISRYVLYKRVIIELVKTFFFLPGFPGLHDPKSCRAFYIWK